MSRRRRAALLLGLALVLGGVAASDVARREAAIDSRLGAFRPVLVTAEDVEAGTAMTPDRLAVRSMPARYTAPGTYSRPGEVAGLTARAPLPSRTPLTPSVLRDPAAEREAAALGRPGERVVEVVAVGDARLILPGSRVDVLVTRDGADGTGGATRLALQDVEVVDARPAPGATADPGTSPGRRVAANLRLTVRQSVYVTQAQSFAREIRLLPRAPG